MQTMPRPQKWFSSMMSEVTAPRASGHRSWGSTKVHHKMGMTMLNQQDIQIINDLEYFD